MKTLISQRMDDTESKRGQVHRLASPGYTLSGPSDPSPRPAPHLCHERGGFFPCVSLLKTVR